MTDRNNTTAYWLCPEPVDMRMGFPALAAMVRKGAAGGTHASIFLSENRRTVRILRQDPSGHTMMTLRCGSDALAELLKRLAERHD